MVLDFIRRCIESSECKEPLTLASDCEDATNMTEADVAFYVSTKVRTSLL